MKAVIYILVTSLTLLVATATANAYTPVPPYMQKAAKAFNVDLSLLYAICSVESKCRPSAINHDDGTQALKLKGVISKSYGMFQIKHSVAKALGFKGKQSELLKPEVNAWYAAKLLQQLYGRYKHTTKVISAYNAGKPSKRNTEYVNKVLNAYATFSIDRRVK